MSDDLRRRVAEVQKWLHVLHPILGELPKCVWLFDRGGEVDKLTVIRELAIAIDRLAEVGERLNFGNAKKLRLALLGVVVECDRLTDGATHVD